MSLYFTFSNFAYFDTNILSYLAKHKELWAPLFQFLIQRDLTLALGEGNITELSDAGRLHNDLADMFLVLPTALVKSGELILDQEIEAHPRSCNPNILHYPLYALNDESNGREIILNLLSKKLTGARSDQKQHAKLMPARHAQNKSNFPPLKTGKYSRKQAEEFSHQIVIQWLSQTHYDFLSNFRDHLGRFNPDTFKSIRLYALVIFYKYYLGQREPTKLSDFGDLFHLYLIPYCKLAVMERDLGETLQQIKKHHGILDDTEIRDINFIRNT